MLESEFLDDKRPPSIMWKTCKGMCGKLARVEGTDLSVLSDLMDKVSFSGGGDGGPRSPLATPLDIRVEDRPTAVRTESRLKPRAPCARCDRKWPRS